MIVKTLLSVCLALSTPNSASAQKMPHQPAKRSHAFKSWDEAADAVKKQTKELERQRRDCQRATSAYNSYFFSGGKHDERKTHDLRSEKDSECRKTIGEETELLEVLSAAEKFLDGDIAAKEAKLGAAKPGKEKDDLKKAIDAARARRKDVQRKYQEHKMGHQINPHKR
ncbi:MAG: hypothetical protein HY078_11975 [Elusimicrobia bacterium]|nr:hypothetical protein [Elusimicrobiota bacterium]